jgi:uncharacterized protein YegL
MKHTEVIFIVDKSGSMAHLTGDTIGGFNGFIESQKAIDGKATLTTVLFDTYTKTLHDGVDIHEVKPMTKTDYIAGGATAMLDAIGETINRVQDRHDELGVEKPDNVIVAITTDGEENSSRKFTKSQIEKMIKHQTNSHGWKFMFLGANMDAVKEAESIGISKDWSVTYDYTTRGVNSVYATMDCMATAARTDIEVDGSVSDVYAMCLNDDNTLAHAKSYVDSALDTTKISTVDDAIASITSLEGYIKY